MKFENEIDEIKHEAFVSVASRYANFKKTRNRYLQMFLSIYGVKTKKLLNKFDPRIEDSDFQNLLSFLKSGLNLFEIMDKSLHLKFENFENYHEFNPEKRKVFEQKIKSFIQKSELDEDWWKLELFLQFIINFYHHSQVREAFYLDFAYQKEFYQEDDNHDFLLAKIPTFFQDNYCLS